MLRPDVAEEVRHRYPRGLNQELASSMLPGDIMVVDACGSLEAGLTGDVTIAGLIQRGGVGMIVDGALRDKGAILEMNVSIYCRGWHASGYSRRLLPYEPFVTIQCAGVTIIPGDVIVGDAEGVITIPYQLADDVAKEVSKLDAKERIQRQMIDVEQRPLTSVYPPDEETQREIERRLKEQEVL
jgi:regulator of RNase E activity RraA